MTIDEIRKIIKKEVYAIVVDESDDDRYSAEVVDDSIESAAFHIYQQLEKEKTTANPPSMTSACK